MEIRAIGSEVADGVTTSTAVVPGLSSESAFGFEVRGEGSGGKSLRHIHAPPCPRMDWLPLCWVRHIVSTLPPHPPGLPHGLLGGVSSGCSFRNSLKGTCTPLFRATGLRGGGTVVVVKDS